MLLNILKKKQKNVYLHSDFKENKNFSYNDIKNYPISNKEWFDSVYSYNDIYNKTLVSYNNTINSLFKSYLNIEYSKHKNKLLSNKFLNYKNNNIILNADLNKHIKFDHEKFFLKFIYL